ncbi:hypothetical protein PYW07_007078 [Mythimna separata]|uniref:FAM194 C-terminal domain-containing protein n=1 Tax=Mythimna separata TaxID=271217 RepID=A0AAD7Z137_MYTSE|nr:hypothetical protein PYW07_007078 [Mythimna separata]
MGKTDIKVHKQGVAFFGPIEPDAKSFGHTSHLSEKIITVPNPSIVDSDTTFVETHEGVKAPSKTSINYHTDEILEKVPSVDTNDALKRRHDLSLRQMVRREKDFGVPFFVHKRPNIYETPKTPTHSLRDSNDQPRKTEKYFQKKIAKGSYDFEERPKKDKSLEGIVHTKCRSSESAGTVVLFQYSSSSSSNDKDKKKGKHLTELNVSSSHLIKVTKEKFRLQAEEKKKKDDQARQQNLEQDHKKKLAHEKKNKTVDETEKYLTRKSAQVNGIEMEKLKALKQEKSKSTTNTEKRLQKKLGTKKTQDSFDDIKVSMSKTHISISKEQKDTSESKQVLTQSEAEFLKLKRDHLKAKEAALRKKILKDSATKRKELTEPEPKEIEAEMKNIKIENESAELVFTHFKLGKAISKIKNVSVVNIPTVESKETLHPLRVLPEKKKKKEEKKKKSKKEQTDKVLRYALSDRAFIDKGWTLLPTEKIMRKTNVYRMRPAQPEFDWFKHNKNKRQMTYDTGERLAEFDENGRGRWYYRSGRLALDYYDAEETNAKQRFVVYSSGEPDERGRTHPITVLATFDYLGNGIVFDHAGKIRLKYNQNEGVVLDRAIGPASHWQWHSLNNPPVLEKVMVDTQMTHKDPNILKLETPSPVGSATDNVEMLAIEFDNLIKEKSKELSQKFKPFQIKMKALKINEHFSLKVLDQATVYLIFRDGLTNLKLNIGMILDYKEIVDIDTAEVGEISNSLERFPARTNSLAGLQRSVAHAQRYERLQRSRRLPESSASADLLTAAASPPLRLPLRTVPSGSSCNSGNRKPANNLYYDSHC